MTLRAYLGADIFDGARRVSGQALLVEGGRIVGIVPDVPEGAEVTRLEGGVIAPGLVDLQVNGGGGVMFNDDPSVDTLRVMARAHIGLGATAILPTLITDTPAHSRAAIDAVEAAIAQGMPGIAGLHLEGPHLSVARKGAHDPSLIRAMGDGDLEMLCAAAARLPVLKMTLAPEAVTPEQIRALTGAGVLVSLGHSDAGFDACVAAVEAGAACATHLFNAMSQLGNREPGLVGAVLAEGRLSAGLIADGVHVHPATIRAAMAAKTGPGRIFLVSDAMSVAGSEQQAFTLNGREIRRAGGRLTLENGTLAGADLDLPTAIRNLAAWGICDRDHALAMATSIPAELIGAGDFGHLRPGARADFIHLATDGLRAVWKDGTRIGQG